MNTMPRFKKHRYPPRVGIFLIAIAFIVGTVGCAGGGGGVKYSLTMSVAPGDSGTATDLTNASPYTEGAIISIKGEANTGYKFVGWTAPEGTFGNANASVTIFAMPGANVTVTANFALDYDLSMVANPTGVGTATDLFNASPYVAGTVVSIQAVAAAGYQFLNWTASAGTFADSDAEQTTFTMPAQNVTVTANFGALLQHFTCYMVNSETYVGENVTLEDQFGAVNATVGWAMVFANPAGKLYGEEYTPIYDADHHLTIYNISCEEEPGEWSLHVNNQFGAQNLTVVGPVALAIPTQKVEPGGHEPPVGLDHYLLYQVIGGTPVEAIVALNDEFGNQTGVEVYEPLFFASPVRKTHNGQVTEVLDPDMHGVIYSIEGAVPLATTVQVVNQFGEQALNVSGPSLLAVPSAERMAVAVLGDYSSQLTDLLLANDISAEERDWDIIGDIGNYDVVVVNSPSDPGNSTFQAFLDAASDNGVGVVFTSSYPASAPYGISLLQWYLGNPIGQSHDWGDGDVYYKVTQEHPILDGWHVGDEITIITGGDCDHAWFWDYSGDTIVDVGSVAYGIRGDAVAVSTYGGSVHVLLAGLAPQSYTNVPDWTDDARTILMNVVCFAAGPS